MPQRTLIGRVADAGGVAITSGELRLTPVTPADDAGFVVQGRSHPIVDGRVMATVVVPGKYAIDIRNASGTSLANFVATIGADTLADVTLKDLWDARDERAPSAIGPLRDGDSILRLAPGGGYDGHVLARSNSGLRWTPAPTGDMRASTYDPTGRRADAFDRANHTGTQPIASVTGLQDALDAKSAADHTHDAADIDSGIIAPERLGAGIATAGTFLRGDGTWAPVSGVQWAEIYYELPAGTNGQSSVAGQWTTLLFNSFGVNDFNAAVAGDGTITLPAGVYAVDVDAAAYGCHENTLRLYNVTAGTTIRVGLNSRPISTAAMYQSARLKASFTLNAASQIRVQHIAYVSTTGGYGLSIGHLWSGFGQPENVNVYASVFIQRRG